MNAPNPVKSILIVESHNDAAFIHLLLNKLGVDAELSIVVEHLHKFLDESGEERRGKEAIGEKLKTVRRELEKKFSNVEKLGVILDFDFPHNWNKAKNLQLINTSIASAFGAQPTISEEGQFVTIDTLGLEAGYEGEIQVACFFTKDSSGEGNLDTLLLEIRANQAVEVPYADCLVLWRDCVNQSDSKLKVSPGTFRKIWLGNFLRSKAKELGKEGEKILKDFDDKQSEVISKLGPSVFDLEHDALNPLRDFLMLFKNTPNASK